MIVGQAKKRKEARASDRQGGSEDNEVPSTSLLEEFVQSWSAGPACVLHREDDGAVANALSWNNDFHLEEHREQLSQDLQASIQKQSPEATRSKQLGRIQWDITATGAGRYLVCLGKRIREETTNESRKPDAESSPRTSSPAEVSAKTDATAQNDSKRQRTAASSSTEGLAPKQISPGVAPHAAVADAASAPEISLAEQWFQRWEALDVPGVAEEDSKAHIGLLRSVDWSKTSIGPMETWSSTLLSILGQALASPFPVLLAWGPDLVMLYNHPYGQNINEKHPHILGLSYQAGWPEVWEFLIPPTSNAMAGKVTHVNNAQMFLQRANYLEECYFTWSMIPIHDPETAQIVGIYIPNFDNTQAVVAERRIRMLREASQSFNVNTNTSSLFRRVCRAVSREPVDLPLVAFYDCSAADDEKDDSLDSSTESSMLQAAPGTPADSGEHPDANIQNVRNSITVEDIQETKLSVRFTRAALTGASEDSEVFPFEVPPSQAGEEIKGVHQLFLEKFRRVQRTHKQVNIDVSDLDGFVAHVDKTPLGDTITTLVILPILTVDDNLRAIAIIGLNPRKAYDEDYQVFLDLFKSQVSHGVTSIRLINEEIRRARFFAALIRRKNEELHQMLEARTEELRSSEMKFLKMSELSPAGIWTATPDGEVTFVNEAWYKISGHPKELGPSSHLDSVHPDDLALVKQNWERSLTDPHAMMKTEFRWKARPGDMYQRWCWGVSVPELDESGNMVAVVGALTDITEKKMMELHQQHRAEEAIELRRAQERFIDMTSHEMRNPLSAICLSADASAERLEAIMSEDITKAADPAVAESAKRNCKSEIQDTLQDLKIIGHCTDHMRRLIDDVLTLSKLDNQFLVITPVPCRPVDFLEQTLSVFQGEMRSKDIKAEYIVKPGFAANGIDYVLTDPSRINQLIINILTNAIKFTAASAQRRITLAVDCSTFQPVLPGASDRADAADSAVLPSSPSQELYLVCSISDTGRGLTPQEIGGLFQRFKQANARTHISYGGSGLGLFICKRLAELLGGEIGVESTRGKGSTFTFYVPIKKCASPVQGDGTPSPSLAPLFKQHSIAPLGAEKPLGDRAAVPESIRVLITEDNLINQKLLDKHLTRMKCITSIANHGQEAIDRIKGSSWCQEGGPGIDVVLMDIEMPVLDGLAAIRLIRAMEASGEIKGRIPVLAVTANARDEQIKIMIDSGFDGTISKPFKVPIIMERMRTLLAVAKVKPPSTSPGRTSPVASKS